MKNAKSLVASVGYLALLFVAYVVVPVSANTVQQLTDETFDDAIKVKNNDAQMADWIINFCDFNLSNKCKKMQILMEDLAESLEGEIQVANVNV